MLGIIFAGVVNTGLICVFFFRTIDIMPIIFVNSMLGDCLYIFPRWMES